MNISEELMASCEIIITGHDLSTMVFNLMNWLSDKANDVRVSYPVLELMERAGQIAVNKQSSYFL